MARPLLQVALDHSDLQGAIKAAVSVGHEVDVIEAGFAAASPGDFSAIQLIAENIKNSTITSLARAVKSDIEVAAEAIKKATKPRIHTFIATSPVHREFKLKMSKEEILKSVDEMVRYAKSFVEDIEFSAEDAMRTEKEYLVEVYETAIKAGATTINIPDTVGYRTPNEMFETIKYLKDNIKGIENVDISVHCHNDLGLAVANSIAAVEAVLQATITNLQLFFTKKSKILSVNFWSSFLVFPEP